MKKALSLLLLILMTVSLLTVHVLADEAAMDVYVTISDENGELVLIKAPVSVTDEDRDGVLTVNDALIAAHNTYCEGGYRYENISGKPQITALWGESDRAYGVFNNGGYVWMLNEYLEDDDHIQAYVYTDNEALSDSFSYFSKEDLTFENGKETLTLYAYSITADGNLLSQPAAGATITVNGKDTKIKTDKDGKFTISAKDLVMGEENVISAHSDRERIVPPVLVVTPNAENIKKTYSDGLLLALMVLTVILVTAVVFTVRMITKKNKTASAPIETTVRVHKKRKHKKRK